MVKPKPKLKDFVPQRVNANKHSERGMRMLSQSIEKNGVIGAMTVAANGETFDGSATWETCVQTFGEEVEPIIVRSDGSRPVIHIREDLATADDPRAVELGIAANRVAEVNLSYDLDVLNEIGGEIDLSSMFYPQELESLLEGMGDGSVFASQKEEEDEDELNELLDKVDEIESRVKPGEIWQLGRHKIACADSTVEKNVRGLLGDRFDDVGMVWSDCPYGMRLDADFSKMGKGIPEIGVNKSKGYENIIGDHEDFDPSPLMNLFSFVDEQFWWGFDYYAERIPNRNDGSVIVWDKRVLEQLDPRMGSSFELCWSKSRHKRDIARIQWSGYFGTEKEFDRKRCHPTQKPTLLCEWFFEKYGQPNDLILDPFLGSAPSIIAAQKLEGDRTVYGFELSPAYCEVILRRFESLTGEVAKLVGHLPKQ